MQPLLVITGASRGIAKATAEYFSDQGWEVVNLSRHACDVTGVTNITVDFSQQGWKINATQVLKAFFENNNRRLCLVHSAATSCHDTIQDLDFHQLEKMFAVNLLAPLKLNQLLLPYMDQNSSIIYIGSTLAEKAVPGSASYVITKHALAGAMKATCQDLISTPHIHTCCVCPGFTQTQMLEDIFCEPGQLELLYNKVSKHRLIQPEEIASLIYFCALNPVVNGSMIHANLGQKES